MIINRHNYEHYFLLYVDKELSAQERMAVNEFVQANPDLRTELELLLKTTFRPEAVSFDKKELLLKTEPGVLQEQLLLHLDNELPENEVRELMEALEKNPVTANEWQSLQQTKLNAKDTVEFPFKKTLYRKEQAKLVSFRMWRNIAAAAILLLALFIGGKQLFNNKPMEDIVVTKAVPNQNPTTTNDDINAIDSTLQEEKMANVPLNNSEINIKKILPVITNNPLKKEKPINEVANRSIVQKKKAVPNKNDPPSNLENFNKEDRNQTAVSTVTQQKEQELQKRILKNELLKNEPVAVQTKPLSAPDVEMTALPVNEYGSVAMLTPQTEEANDNKILFMQEEKLNRSKVGGFLRKVKRTIERKTNIKSGKSLKIAGFEIAAN